MLWMEGSIFASFSERGAVTIDEACRAVPCRGAAWCESATTISMQYTLSHANTA